MGEVLKRLALVARREPAGNLDPRGELRRGRRFSARRSRGCQLSCVHHAAAGPRSPKSTVTAPPRPFPSGVGVSAAGCSAVGGRLLRSRLGTDAPRQLGVVVGEPVQDGHRGGPPRPRRDPRPRRARERDRAARGAGSRVGERALYLVLRAHPPRSDQLMQASDARRGRGRSRLAAAPQTPTRLRCLRRRARGARRPRSRTRPRQRATAGGTAGGARSSTGILIDHMHAVIVSPGSDSSVRPMQIPGAGRRAMPPSHARSQAQRAVVILASWPPERVCALGPFAGTYSPVSPGFCPRQQASAPPAWFAETVLICRQKQHKRP